MRTTVKACYKGAGPNLIRKCWLWHHIKITTWEDLEKERISNSKSYKGVELNTKWYVLTIKCIFIARKIRHGKFLAKIWSQCTCQYDVVMKILMFCSCSDRRIMQFLTIEIVKNLLNGWFLITGLLIKGCIFTILKILRKVIIVHTRLWKHHDVVYESQKCKGIHLIWSR